MNVSFSAVPLDKLSKRGFQFQQSPEFKRDPKYNDQAMAGITFKVLKDSKVDLYGDGTGGITVGEKGDRKSFFYLPFTVDENNMVNRFDPVKSKGIFSRIIDKIKSIF